MYRKISFGDFQTGTIGISVKKALIEGPIRFLQKEKQKMGKRLSYESIEASPEIQNWLTQFAASDALAAKSLLSRLEFISRDEYSEWLLKELASLSNQDKSAIYSVRKFDKDDGNGCLWQKDGKIQLRPAQTQGSEDFVSSIISNANRLYNKCFLDHPSLMELRDYRIRNIILVDDSIGSGKRVSDFIAMMTKSKTFMSWWSFGFIKLYILCYARTVQSETYIRKHIAGSDHGQRINRVSSKIQFISHIVYDSYNVHGRWGENLQSILSLCMSYKKINRCYRKGYGNVMGNIIFYHSVPNNIPGMLFYKSTDWQPLFPGRVLPAWVAHLLENPKITLPQNRAGFKAVTLSDDLVRFLNLIRTGVRKKKSLAYQLECEILIVQKLIDNAIRLGLISSFKRLTKIGKDFY